MGEVRVVLSFRSPEQEDRVAGALAHFFTEVGFMGVASAAALRELAQREAQWDVAVCALNRSDWFVGGTASWRKPVVAVGPTLSMPEASRLLESGVAGLVHETAIDVDLASCVLKAMVDSKRHRTMVHDVRNVLSIALNAAHFLRRDAPPSLHRDVLAVTRAVERCEALVTRSPRLDPKEQDARLARETKQGLGEDMQGRHVLLVDDERLVRVAVRRMIGRFGVVVSEAGTGSEALALFAREPTIPVDVVVLDLDLPDMTGVEVAEEIWRRNPGQAIVFTSGYPELLKPQVADKAVVVPKPFAAERLFAGLHAAMRRSGGATDSEETHAGEGSSR